MLLRLRVPAPRQSQLLVHLTLHWDWVIRTTRKLFTQGRRVRQPAVLAVGQLKRDPGDGTVVIRTGPGSMIGVHGDGRSHSRPTA